MTQKEFDHNLERRLMDETNIVNTMLRRLAVYTAALYIKGLGDER